MRVKALQTKKECSKNRLNILPESLFRFFILVNCFICLIEIVSFVRFSSLPDIDLCQQNLGE